MPRRPQQTSRRRIQAALRESEFLTLRLAGHSYPEIARRAGAKSTGHVFRVVKTALVRAATLSTASAAQLRLIELDRLDIAIDTLLPRVLKGDDDAISLYLKALKQRADLLGLNAPVKVVGPDGGPVQLQPVPAAPMDAEPQRLLGTAALQAALDALPDEQLEQLLAISARLKASLAPVSMPLPGGPILDVPAQNGADARKDPPDGQPNPPPETGDNLRAADHAPEGPERP